jgi:hypothetical protein
MNVCIDDIFKSQPKRLRTAKQVAKEKQIKKILNLKTFFEYEAELGSDNEQHDDVVKRIREEDDELEDDNEDLKELITDEVEEDKGDIKEKYFNDMMAQDKEDIRKVIKGPQLQTKLERTEVKFDHDHLPLDMRLKKFKGNEETLYTLNGDVLFKNLHSLEQQLDENTQNPELKEMYKTLENDAIKKVAMSSKAKSMNNRMIENDKILENVINLNEVRIKEEKKSIFFHKGTIKPCSLSTSQINTQKYGFNKNSILHAIKNDKDYGQEKETMKDCNINTNINAEEENNHSYFSSKLNIKCGLNNKTNNLSSLFKNGNGSRTAEGKGKKNK